MTQHELKDYPYEKDESIDKKHEKLSWNMSKMQ